MESIAKEAISCSIPCILTHVGYPFNCKTNVQILQRKLTDLGSMRDDIERYVKTAQEKGDSIKSIVERWQEKVITVQDKATELIRASEDINRWFQGWWCLDRYHLGKDAHENIEIMSELIREGGNYKSASCVSDRAPLPGLLSSVDFQAFLCRESSKNEIIEALKDEKINRVGVWGMGGVGKTTLIKKVGQQVTKDQEGEQVGKLFDRVVMVTVSQNPDLIKIRGELAMKLGIENFTPGHVWLGLKVKKILIILDDIWKYLDLNDLGISLGDDQKSCKVVFTSRSEETCNALNTQKNIEVECLSNQDSWDLFRSNVGDVVVDDELARKVAEECKGLPLAIVTLGRALRGKDQLVWEDAAKQLETSIYFQRKSPVFSSIKFSYDYLEREEIKQIFLFCCFFPEDTKFNVDDLIWLVLGEELLPNVDTLEDTRRRLHTIFNKLKASCLLLEGHEWRPPFHSVMMHDIVRDAAISIAHEESNSFIVKAGLGLKRWPVMKNLRTCKRLSLIGNKISELPDQPECPQLLSLSLSSNFSFTKIPDCFFERMTSLVALDLSQNSLSSLPPSLSCLVNLRTLCLQRNPLSDVSLVGELKKLEYLNLSETEIQSLPEGVGRLTNLRFFSCFNTPCLKIIPNTVLSNLSRLEDLYLGIKGFLWYKEMGDESNARSPYLSQEMLGEDLKKFIITVDHSRVGHFDYQRSMVLDAISDPLANWVKVLLRKTEFLCLDGCQGLKSIVKVGEGGFDNLKVLKIKSCNEMEYLTCVVEDSPQITFNDLEELELQGLNGFEVIHRGSLPNRFLGKLKTLKVSHCQKIVKLLPCDLLLKLQNLEVLELDKCDKLKEVFHTVGIEEGHVAIPRLRKMSLSGLPSLTTIWKRVIPLVSFQELNCLEVKHCERLRYLFTRTMVQRLQRLEKLEIINCSQMKKIIKSEEDEEDEEDEIMVEEETVVEREQDETVQFPRLRTLRLLGLPKFLGFYRPNILWPSLEFLHVHYCPNLEKRPLGLQSATKLSELSGDNFEWFEGLEWEDQSVKSRLQPLFVPRTILVLKTDLHCPRCRMEILKSICIANGFQGAGFDTQKDLVIVSGDMDLKEFLLHLPKRWPENVEIVCPKRERERER